MQSSRQSLSESDIAVYVAVDALFPGAAADETAMLSELARLSRDDALFTCARINAIVSGFGPGRSLYERQKQVIQMLCSPEQMRTLDAYARRHGGPHRVVAFFRGQLLELARWIALHCKNLPGDGETFSAASVRSTFVRAAFIASHLWQARLFGSQGIKLGPDRDAQLLQLLGAFRKCVEEGNQSGHAGFAVSRGWSLLSQHLPAHLPSFPALFEDLSGINLRQYFICSFALLDRSFSDKPEQQRIFRTDYVGGDNPFREKFAKYMRLQSQTPEDWTAGLGVTHDFGNRSLRERPIFRFQGGRSIIFDPTFYLDSIVVAPLFRIISTGVSAQAAFSAFGLAFEDYAVNLLRTRFPSGSGVLHQRLRCGVKGRNAGGESFEIDGFLNDVTAAVVFEVKAAWLREETILTEDSGAFLDEIRRKYGYVESSDERPKGVAQLARSIGALARREWKGPNDEYSEVTSIYPVLTVFDARMGAPGMGRFLADEFRTLLGPLPAGIFVHSLIIMTVSDLEHLVSAIETLSLPQFLRAYSTSDPDRVSSVHNFIATSDFMGQVRASPLLEELSGSFMEAVREELPQDADAH